MNGTKEFEADLDAAVSFGRQVMRESAEKLAPYPMGMQPIATDDQVFDFQNRGADYCQTLMGKAIGDATTSGLSIGDALLAFMTHIKQMQEKANGN